MPHKDVERYMGTVNVDVPVEAGYLIFGQSQSVGPGVRVRHSCRLTSEAALFRLKGNLVRGRSVS